METADGGQSKVSTATSYEFKLLQDRRKIAGTVEDSDDLQSFLFWIVNDQIVRIQTHKPEAKR
jgi:hypothetical protein